MVSLNEVTDQAASVAREAGGRVGEWAQDIRQKIAGGSQDRKSGQQQINVSDAERKVSLAAGSILALFGLWRRSIPGLLIAGAGGALAYRGITGHCPGYQAMGIDTAHEPGGQRRGSDSEEISERGIHIEQAFQINKPAQELYAFWRNFENLPQIMTHLESVTVSGEGRSHWVAKAQVMGDRRFEWDAEITREEPDTLIGWRSLPGGDIECSGEIRFSKALGDRGTDVHVFMDYVPPGGRAGHWIASMLGQNPRRLVREDLRNFKRLMELGEILTLIGQPHGTCRGEGKPYSESRWKPYFM